MLRIWRFVQREMWTIEALVTGQFWKSTVFSRGQPSASKRMPSSLTLTQLRSCRMRMSVQWFAMALLRKENQSHGWLVPYAAQTNAHAAVRDMPQLA